MRAATACGGCAAAGAVAAAAAAGFVLSFPYPPHALPLADGRAAVNWDARAPRLAQAFNRVFRPWEEWLLPLDPPGLIARARARAGLDDYGGAGGELPAEARAGLDRFVSAFVANRPAPINRLFRREQLTGYLVTRLRVRQLTLRHPEILDEPVTEPVFIVGLPRTGTTHLLNLLAGHPSLRALPLWEAMDPIAPDGGVDRRADVAEYVMQVPDYFTPLMKRMHPMEPRAPHEDIHLLAVSFCGFLLDTLANRDEYREWYEAGDHTEAYRYFRVLLQVLQWQDRRRHRGAAPFAPRRWLLKTPMHSEQTVPLLRVFPDARVVRTHRDPLPVVRSFLTLVTYGYLGGGADSAHGAGAWVPRVGGYWARRLERMMRRSVDDDAAIPPGQVVDVHFADLVADNFAAVRRVCAAVGLPLAGATAAEMRARIGANPRGRHGELRYDLAPFGVDEAELRARLRFYVDHFGVKEE